MQRIFIKKCFLFIFGSVCLVKRFHLDNKHFADEEVEIEVWKWMRQQSQYFYAAGWRPSHTNIHDSTCRFKALISLVIVAAACYIASALTA
jgi:hypothetical protein